MEQTKILAELEREGFLVITTRGVSMQPLLYTNESQVLIRRLQERPQKNDVVLYTRPDGELVLHRVIRVEGDTCLIRGDNTFGLEPVSLSAVKGVMERLWSRKCEISVTDLRYRLYVWFWNLIYPFRWLKDRAKQGVKRVGRWLLGETSLAWVIRKAKGSLRGILLTAFCEGIVSMLSVALALVMRGAIDSAVAGNPDAFLRWVAVFLAVMAGTLGLNAALRQLYEAVMASMENRIKTQIYDSILRSRYSGLKTFHTGELQNRLTSDVRIVAGNAADLIPDIVSMLVQLVCALFVLMALDWRFASIFLVGGLVMLGVTFLFRRKMKSLHKEVQEKDGKLRSWMQESVENLLLVKSFQAEQMASDRTKEWADEHKKARMRRRTFSNVCNVGFGAVMQGSYLFGLVWCCVGILQGTLTYGTLTAVLQLINQIRGPFANMSGLVPQYYSMLASAERLMEIESLPRDERPQKALPEFQSLHARNLTFIYDDGEDEVIRAASFDIQKGELVALTGVSGIGKSTLLKLLLGIYRPVSGRLYAKAACSGMEESEAPQAIDIDASTRGWFSYVPQGNMLMSESIYEAVDFLHAAPYTQAQKERVKQACRIACADAFIRELPKGYQTVLGERGVGLSEGQLQRLAIARAIYRNAPILLLDEATSALDEETERQLLRNLKQLGKQTVLIVTHRPAALQICGKRLVFEHERICAESMEPGERESTG
ncbi:MAG: ATP-binding cassette domain-containing protein [Clostridiales bacterium]|nr:ATP-binding cassette domain-containing protein [Clostridiales bacterium]